MYMYMDKGATPKICLFPCREIPDPQTNVSKPGPYGGTDLNRQISCCIEVLWGLSTWQDFSIPKYDVYEAN